MANKHCQRIRFDQAVGQPDAVRLMFALSGVCTSLDRVDINITSAMGKEAERASGLAAAAALLSEQLLASHIGSAE